MKSNQTKKLSELLNYFLNQHSIQVGIFWLVQGELVFITEQLTSEKQSDSYCANYDMYDEMYTIDRIHRDVWEDLRKQNKLPSHVTVEQDFGDYPRGRILFDPHTKSHYVYSASWLVSYAPFQKLISQNYSLINPRFVANEQYEIDKDEHLCKF